MAPRLLQHVHCVQQVYILVDAVVNLEHSSASGLSSEVDVTPPSGGMHMLTHKAACVTKLVLESQYMVDLSASAVEEQEANSRSLRWIRQLVYGAQAVDTAIMHLVYSMSVEQAQLVRQVCLEIVQHHLHVSNCFRVLETAVQTGIPCLLKSSLDLASSAFKAALKQDCTGWAALSREGMSLVLCNCNLQVNSEVEVFEALVTWVEACPEKRLSHFEDIFVQVVQVHEMQYEEAQLIDSHPLVAKHQKAYMHVAHALLAWHMQKPGLLSNTWPIRSSRARSPKPLQAADELPTASMQTHADSATPESLTQHASAGPTSQASRQGLVEQGPSAEPLEQMQLSRPHLQQHDQAIADQHLQCCRSRDDDDSAQQNQHEAHGDVSLSCSMDEDMLPELDADVSSRLQPFPSQCSGAKVASQYSGSNNGLAYAQAVHLTVRTGRYHKDASSGACAQLQHEMALSPSAQQGRRKQARLGSARSLKF